MIQATVGCAAGIFCLLFLMQLVVAAMTPAMPDFAGFDRTMSPAEMQQAQAEMQQAINKRAQSAKTVLTVQEVFYWLAFVASFGSLVAFGFFLGAVGEHFGREGLRRLAMGFAVFQAACAVWLILLIFVIDIDSAGRAKFLLAVSLALSLATYGWLIYLNLQARSTLPADA